MTDTDTLAGFIILIFGISCCASLIVCIEDWFERRRIEKRYRMVMGREKR